MDMPFPYLVCGIKKRNWCLAVLGSLVYKSAKRCLPFFKVLKGPRQFSWIEECQRTLEGHKTYLAPMPRITKHVVGEELHLYVAVSMKVISAIY